MALWSLQLSASTWTEILSDALSEDVVLQHATRGRQKAEDIARNNAHDVTHHLWDIKTILKR